MSRVNVRITRLENVKSATFAQTLKHRHTHTDTHTHTHTHTHIRNSHTHTHTQTGSPPLSLLSVLLKHLNPFLSDKWNQIKNSNVFVCLCMCVCVCVCVRVCEIGRASCRERV